MKFLKLAFLLTVVFFLVRISGSGVISAQNNHQSDKIHRVFSLRRFHSLCSLNIKGNARCHAKIVENDTNSNPLLTATPLAQAMGPVQFHTAYNLPCTPMGPMQTNCTTPQSYGSQTIAIVIAYHSPNLESDLTTYSNYYGIPLCTIANGCLQVINQNGGAALPSVDLTDGWTLEEALDTQVAHSICQTCKILVVEANSSSMLDLATAVNTAASLGVSAISNSYGTGSEWSGETAYDSYYNHPGIAVTASSGDNGYGSSFPSSSPYVVSVGGTTLNLFTDNSYSDEKVWYDGSKFGTGSGCSIYEPSSIWQLNLANWNSTGCLSKRGASDVSADADPNTGAAVYHKTGWYLVGGTSLSSPLIAGIFALAAPITGNINAGSILYQNSVPNAFHDVTIGTNGSCTTSMCNAGIGYDGPTGLGTPNGILGFLQNQVSPTPTATPTATPTPTDTPTPTATPTPTLSPTPTPPSDTQAPVIKITRPANNSFVFRNSNVTISATASDNVKVTKVELYINNVLGITLTNSPYNATWRVPSQRRVSYTIMAKAYDAAGNTSTASVKVTSF